MKFFQSTIRICMAAVVVTGVVICARAVYIPIKNDARTPINQAVLPDFNQDVLVKNYARTLTYQTMIGDDHKVDDKQFAGLYAFIKTTYPAFFATLTQTRVGKHGLLFKWQGKNADLKPVLFMAHQDVVPIAPGTTSAWQHPPFAGVVAAGYIYGRGALDCKATFSALLAASESLLQKKFTPERTIYFYFGDDEESGGATAMAARELLQKNKIRFEYVVDEGGLVATDFLPNVFTKMALIGVGEKGVMNLRLTVDAAGGHASMPPAHTAIGDLSEAVNKIVRHPFPSHINGPAEEFLENISIVMPFYKRVILANSWLFSPLIIRQLNKSPAMSALLHTTQAPTIFDAGNKANVLPQQASAVINFRIDLNDTMETVTNHVRKVINNPDVKLSVDKGWNPSSVSSTNTAAYQLMTDTTRRIFGNEIIVTPSIMVGATDSRHFASIADNVYRYSPITVAEADFIRIHGTDERLAAKDYIKLVQYYYELIGAV